LLNGVLDAKWLLATWQLQVAIGSGYTAYMIAYTGIRHHHQTIDTTFRTIAFGLVATAVILSMPSSGKVLVIAVAFGSTVAAGIIWRTIGMAIWGAALRLLDISWADDTPSAWAKLGASQRYHITQISVLTSEGVRLRCNDASLCGELPLGPCVLGTNGDILMYVTHTKKPGEQELESAGMNDPHHGAKLTYLPASSIKRLDVRQKAIPVRGIRRIAGVCISWIVGRWVNRHRQEALPDGSRS
jgi:hypothetical protein